VKKEVPLNAYLQVAGRDATRDGHGGVWCVQGATAQGQQGFQQQLAGRGFMAARGGMPPQMDPNAAELLRSRAGLAGTGALMAGILPGLVRPSVLTP
jgi:hypothetical protein